MFFRLVHLTGESEIRKYAQQLEPNKDLQPGVLQVEKVLARRNSGN
jgi:hypothetical protein